jgi:flagellar hook-associated protein 1
LKKNLEELSTYFPEIDNVGIKNDLKNYFDMWQSLANNPSNTALKVALAQQTQTMTQHIQETRTQVAGLQSSLNDQIKVNVDEVNRIAKEISKINIEINKAEAGGANNANDLRDQRNQLEMTLTKLVNAKVLVGQIETKQCY